MTPAWDNIPFILFQHAKQFEAHEQTLQSHTKLLGSYSTTIRDQSIQIATNTRSINDNRNTIKKKSMNKWIKYDFQAIMMTSDGFIVVLILVLYAIMFYSVWHNSKNHQFLVGEMIARFGSSRNAILSNRAAIANYGMAITNLTNTIEQRW